VDRVHDRLRAAVRDGDGRDPMASGGCVDSRDEHDDEQSEGVDHAHKIGHYIGRPTDHNGAECLRSRVWTTITSPR